VYILICSIPLCGPGSSVGIVTGYCLDGLGIESRLGGYFAHVQTGQTMITVSFTGVKRPGRGADHPPPPSAEVENE
jgi:hypothetical protein